MKNKRGEAVLIVILTIAIIGSIFGGVSHIKHQSKKDAVKVEQVTTKVENNNDAIVGKLGASINQIGVANTMAPQSPSRSFIEREVALVTPIAHPDQNELIKAQERRIAVMSGQIELAEKLYNKSIDVNTKLLEEKAELKSELNKVKQDLFFESGQASTFKLISACVIVLLLIVSIITIYLKITNNSVIAGLRTFVAYNKNDVTINELHESFDDKIKRLIGL